MATEYEKKKKFYDNMRELASDYDDKTHNKTSGSSDNQSTNNGNGPATGGSGDGPKDEEEQHYFYGD